MVETLRDIVMSGGSYEDSSDTKLSTRKISAAENAFANILVKFGA